MTRELCYADAMLKAYVGIASKHGLNVFYSEREETLEWVRSMAGRRVNPKRISFWAVVPDDEACRIAILLHRGQKNEALRLLDRAATDMGQIFPSDVTLFKRSLGSLAPTTCFCEGLPCSTSKPSTKNG